MFTFLKKQKPVKFTVWHSWMDEGVEPYIGYAADHGHLTVEIFYNRDEAIAYAESKLNEHPNAHITVDAHMPNGMTKEIRKWSHNELVK